MSDKDITQMIRKDITERLRDRDNHDSLEAADEIERLRKRLSEYAMDKMAELDKEMGL
jgi:hypothetical protein